MKRLLLNKNLSIHPLPAFPFWVTGVADTQVQWSLYEMQIHPRHVTCPSQGHRRTNKTNNHSHLKMYEPSMHVLGWWEEIKVQYLE